MTVRIINADVMDGLRQLADETVHCVVTSPPYWGLRDYGTGMWEGGDPTCDHRSPTMREGRNEERAKLAGSAATNSAQLLLSHRSACGKCGAIKRDFQLGLEATPEGYVSRMMEVFREVRRVLRSDGTVWLNLGDSYQSAKGQAGGVDPKQPARRHGLRPNDVAIDGLKPKDLVGIPWRVALALQADGWWLRSDIIWAKPNPMPESVTDRPTKSHEYVFLLTKSERYFYDAEAIRETVAETQVGRVRNDAIGGKSWEDRGQHSAGGRYRTPNSPGKIKSPHGQGFTRRAKEDNADARPPATSPHTGLSDFEAENSSQYLSRNKRSVWTIATAPFPEAHFATFPPELPEICIRAGCPQGGTVLDPFSGAGTTCLVANGLGRNAIGIELNLKYAEMSVTRIDERKGTPSMFPSCGVIETVKLGTAE